MGRILAIDYGQKRIGLAVTDELQLIANSLITIHTKDIFSFLSEYLNTEKIDCIVIGEPKQMNNQASESSKFINPFIKKLEKEFPSIPIERCDERFTSKIASQSILFAGLKKKDRQNKSLIDSVSATLILQTYLETKANNKINQK